jgi:hypothetical protein
MCLTVRLTEDLYTCVCEGFHGNDCADFRKGQLSPAKGS